MQPTACRPALAAAIVQRVLQRPATPAARARPNVPGGTGAVLGVLQ